MVFNLKTGKATELIHSPDYFTAWYPSSDGKYLYCSSAGADPKLERIRISDHAVETIANVKDLHFADDPYEQFQMSDSPRRHAGAHSRHWYPGDLRYLGEMAVTRCGLMSATTACTLSESGLISAFHGIVISAKAISSIDSQLVRGLFC